MIKARTWLMLLMLSVGTVAATASCGSDEATGAGASGDAGEGSLIGAAGDGKGGATGRAGASSGGESGSGTGAVGVGTLGATCTGDSDCAGGLTCLTSGSGTLGGQGPSFGMCTVACTQTTECDAIEAGAACVGFGDNGTDTYCFEPCAPGEPLDPTTKCQGRPDFACEDLGTALAPAPFCLPLCQADAGCGTGLYCDLHTGLCGKTKPTGNPVGTACDPNAATETCKGFCITTSATGVTPETGNCAELCSGNTACLYSSGTTPTPGGFCFVGQDSGTSDLGICSPNCECDTDCKFPGDVCRAWANTAAETPYKKALGADGICFPNSTGSVALECGAGGAGGAAGAGN